MDGRAKPVLANSEVRSPLLQRDAKRRQLARDSTWQPTGLRQLAAVQLVLALLAPAPTWQRDCLFQAHQHPHCVPRRATLDQPAQLAALGTSTSC